MGSWAHRRERCADLQTTPLPSHFYNGHEFFWCWILAMNLLTLWWKLAGTIISLRWRNWDTRQQLALPELPHPGGLPAHSACVPSTIWDGSESSIPAQSHPSSSLPPRSCAGWTEDLHHLWPLRRKSVLKRPTMERALIMSTTQVRGISSCPDGKTSALLEAVHKCQHQQVPNRKGEVRTMGQKFCLLCWTRWKRTVLNWIFNVHPALAVIVVAGSGELPLEPVPASVATCPAHPCSEALGHFQFLS